MISDRLPLFFFADIVPEIPVVKSLRADANIAAGKPDIMPTAVVVIKPFKFLPGFFDSSRSLTRRGTPGTVLLIILIVLLRRIVSLIYLNKISNDPFT